MNATNHLVNHTSNDEFDGIILGAGHNALVLQAYLGKAGLRVLCVEQSQRIGGGLTTVENPRFPGFFHNLHSFYHRGMDQMPWYRDLDLERRGASYIEPEFNVALVLKNGGTLEWWTDFEKTVDSFSAFSQKDAQALRTWRERFQPIVENILVPESQSPPLPSALRQQLLSQTSMGRLLLEVSALSPLQFVLQEFSHPVIQAGLLFFNGLREVDLRCRGLGHYIPSLLASRGKAQMCRGGSIALARALTLAVKESGGEFLLGTKPKEILVKKDRAVGVSMESGQQLRARQFVVSGLNPQQTFLELLDQRFVPDSWRQRSAHFRYNLVAPLFALNVCLKEAPEYIASLKRPELQKALMVIIGLETVDQFPQIVRDHELGVVPKTVMWGSCPSQFDSSQAPEGYHTAFMWEKLPYRLGGDPSKWDLEKNHHATRMLECWREYAPNVKDAVVDWFAQSPLDTHRTLPNMQQGDLLVGAFSHGQIGFNRPFPGAGHYRGCINNLYLCGSSSHPGGNITGLVGYNCAQIIFNDLGLDAAWAPSSIEERLIQLCGR
jgi:phytoene dehydrogenase-like protein